MRLEKLPLNNELPSLRCPTGIMSRSKSSLNRVTQLTWSSTPLCHSHDHSRRDQNWRPQATLRPPSPYWLCWVLYTTMDTQSSSAGPSATQGGTLSYDPEQDPEERRRVRRNYRDLARETESRLASWMKGQSVLIDSQMLILPNIPRPIWLSGCIGLMTSSGKVQQTEQQPPCRHC